MLRSIGNLVWLTTSEGYASRETYALRSDTCRVENLEHIVSGPQSIDHNTIGVTGVVPVCHKVHILSSP